MRYNTIRNVCQRLHRAVARAALALANMASLRRFAAAVLLSAALALPGNSESVARRIAIVEQNLLPPVVLKGVLRTRMSLGDGMARFHVPAVSVAVIDNYEIDWARSWGLRDKERNLRADAATVIQAGAISQPVAAAAALRLVADGRLTLDGDVNQWLKSWKVPENDFTRIEKVTVRRILSHSAGLTPGAYPGYERGAPLATIPQILDGLTPATNPPLRVVAVPGSQYRYSAGGYALLQLLIADVTGENFPKLAQELVLAPCGMRQSTFEEPLPTAFREDAATPYGDDGVAVFGGARVYPEMAASGLWTTASDLARFAIEVMKSKDEKGSLLPPRLARDMLRPQSGGYGLGFALQGGSAPRLFGHNGATDGFEAMLLCTTELGRGAVVMTNAAGGIRLARQIMLGIASAYGWPDYRPIERTWLRLPPEALARYAGRYRSPFGDVEIVPAEHGVRLRLGGGDVAFVPESETQFFAMEPGIGDLRFERDPQGRATALVTGNVRAVRIN